MCKSKQLCSLTLLVNSLNCRIVQFLQEQSSRIIRTRDLFRSYIRIEFQLHSTNFQHRVQNFWKSIRRPTQPICKHHIIFLFTLHFGLLTCRLQIRDCALHPSKQNSRGMCRRRDLRFVCTLEMCIENILVIIVQLICDVHTKIDHTFCNTKTLHHLRTLENIQNERLHLVTRDGIISMRKNQVLKKLCVNIALIKCRISTHNDQCVLQRSQSVLLFSMIQGRNLCKNVMQKLSGLRYVHKVETRSGKTRTCVFEIWCWSFYDPLMETFVNSLTNEHHVQYLTRTVSIRIKRFCSFNSSIKVSFAPRLAHSMASSINLRTRFEYGGRDR